MHKLSPELKQKFREFNHAYELALVWLADAGGHPERKSRDAWYSAKRAVPITEVEEDLFRALMDEENASE